jgi:pimeloyl-ACP methyl ester carboxylesterase
MRATVCFCHGRESGPWGTKIRRLALIAERFGCRVISPDDRDTRDPEVRVQRLLTAAADLAPPLILVGSSMGGYVAAVASAQLHPAGLFLMAPAVGLPGYQLQAPPVLAGHVAIVHGWNDAVVPVANVVEFARLQSAALHLLDDGHVLQDRLDQLADLFTDFLADCLGLTGPIAPPRELVAAL